MARRTLDELVKGFNAFMPEEPTEEQINFLGDLQDSYTERDPYEEKYNALLKSYRDRFEGGGLSPKGNPQKEEPKDEPKGNDRCETIRINDLFQ